jgi:exoribonuclease R
VRSSTHCDRDDFVSGLAAIRKHTDLPGPFPPDVVELAEARAARRFDERPLLTDSFMTLDPASSTDLDQAFAVSVDGPDIVLRYAIADVDAFVDDDDPIDQAAWQRGVTVYAADDRVSLYPEAISQRAASLLPDGPRPAVVLTVAVAGDGVATLRSVDRVRVASTTKLAYETTEPDDLAPPIVELFRRITADEERRGAGRVELPEQELVDDPTSACGVRLQLRPRRASEDVNAAMSLASNLAIARAMIDAKVGLFRVMPEPDGRAERALRHVAHGLGIAWRRDESLRVLMARLAADDPADIAFQTAARRASGGASYAMFDPTTPPWHSAIAAPYAHATAPMRRLADRYVLRTVAALAGHQRISADLTERMAAVAALMEKAETIASKVDRMTIDLVECLVLGDRVGDEFDAVVLDVDERGAVVQLLDPPVRTRLSTDREPGDRVRVRVESIDLDQRRVQLSEQPSAS